MHETLGLPRRAGGVEEEERVFGGDGHRLEIIGVLGHLLVPPEVAAVRPGHGGAGALEDQTIRDVGTLLQGFVDDLLGRDGLAAAPALIGRQNDGRSSIQDAIP